MKKTIILLIIILFCNKIKAQTQIELNQNATIKYQKTDAKLNEIYNQLINILDIPQKKLLIIAQKNWIKFRDSNCKFEISDYNGGSIQTLIYSNCLIECTQIRIKQLSENLKYKKQL
ncbi:MAG: hypothetical protein RL528_573 [Bacteroidota bacterium]|jgi:uncharacterized protein YecT (DUF1311 family)